MNAHLRNACLFPQTVPDTGDRRERFTCGRIGKDRVELMQLAGLLQYQKRGLV